MNDDLIQISFHSAILGVEVYGLILMDLEGQVVTWNRGAEQLLGYNEAEAVGRNFEFIFTPEDRNHRVPRQEMETAKGSGHAYDDRWHVRKDGSQIYVNGGLCLLKSETGEARGFVKIIRDQTEKKEQLDKIQELNAILLTAQKGLEDYAATLESKVADRTRKLNERNVELQDFCYSVAHDLRAPLRNMQAMAEVVIEDFGPVLGEKGKEYLGRISKTGAKLDQLTQDLLTYTRFSRDEVLLVPIQTSDVLDEVLQNLGENFSQKNASISVKSPLHGVKGQHGYVAQILGNLLSNALKFSATDRTPQVEVWSENKNGRIRIYVRDNGTGVPSEFHEKIFSLFERLDPHGGKEGSGAGLAIARKAAQRMGGEIGIEDDVREGSTFWLELESSE